MKITIEQISLVQAAIEKKLNDTQWSAERLATEVTRQFGKISSAYISKMRSNDTAWHEKISFEAWEKVARFCGLKLVDDSQTFNWKIKNTINMETVINLCTEAHNQRSMKMIASPTGTGKTTGLKYYQEYKRPADTIYVLLNRLMTPKVVLESIALALGLKTKGNNHHLADEICREMNKRQLLLILDDAGKGIEKWITVFQVLYDNTEGHAGIVLAGTDEMQEVIALNAMRGIRPYPEFESRVSYFAPLPAPSAGIVREICNDHGITEQAAIDLVMGRCTNFRALFNLIRESYRITGDKTRETIHKLKVGKAAYADVKINPLTRRRIYA